MCNSEAISVSSTSATWDDYSRTTRVRKSASYSLLRTRAASRGENREPPYEGYSLPRYTHKKLSRSSFKTLKLWFEALIQTERKQSSHTMSGYSDKISLSNQIFEDYKSRPWHSQTSSSNVNKNLRNFNEN